MTRRNLWRYLLLLPLLVYTLYTFGPFLWAAVMSLRTTQEITANHYGLPMPPHWDKYPTAWLNFGYATYFRNSFIVTAGSVFVVTLVGSMSAYVFARRRFKFPLREPLFLLIFLAIMFPPQITVLALYQVLVKYKLYNTLQGLLLVYSAAELPLTVFLLRGFFSQIPQDIEDAARMDGCSDFQMFWRVMFPMARPAVATTVVLNFITYWNEFLYAVVLVHRQQARTLPLAVMFLLGEQYQDVGMLATGLMIATLPVIILYVFFSEQFIQGITAGALKG